MGGRHEGAECFFASSLDSPDRPRTEDLEEAEVNAAFAIEAGGTSEGEPAIRAYFGPSYYAANIADFDGNHLEIVHKSFNPPSRQHLM